MDYTFHLSFKLATNVLRVAAVGDFGVPHVRDQPRTNFDRSTELDLTTAPAITPNGCVCPDKDREMMGEGLLLKLVEQFE